MNRFQIFTLLVLFTIRASASPVISEFLTANASGYLDEDDKRSDWIEIHNPSQNPVELSGWHLTDDSTNLTKWTFPSHILAPDEYLVVIASGNDRAVSGSEFHTNFSLSRSSDYLALVSPTGNVSTSFNYPNQTSDVSFGPTKTGSELVLISQSSPAKALVPTSADDNAIGTTWRNNIPVFDDSTWLSGSLGVGFERSNGFKDEFGIDVEGAWALNSTVYVRVPVPGIIDPSAVQSLLLRMKYDDGFAAFINGTYAVGSNDPATLLWNSDADGDVTDSTALQFQDFDISASIPNLVASGNLLAIHGMNRFSNSSDLLIRPELIATLSNPVPPTIGFFDTPTPGAENPSTNFEVLLGDTRFQIGRGFFSAPFTETITSTDPGTTIIYTTDGSVPSPGNGVQVPSPDAQTPAQATVAINSTTVLRATAIRSNALPTNVDTQTYLFHSDVLTQDGTGLPSPSKNTSIWDYSMDPNLVNDPRYPSLTDDLKTIPTLSVNLPADEMWGRDGIYANPRQTGAAWERACSVEYLLPDGSSGFQQDAGIRIQGAGARFRDRGKKSLRIAFRTEYGESKLNYPLFGSRAANELDNIVLRGAYFDSWTVHTSGSGTEGIGRRNALLFRDEFGRQSHQDMGAYPVVQGNWAHVYFNGIYWGIYNLHERIDEHFAEDRFGGDDSEYDVLKQRLRGQSNGSRPEIVNGDLIAWNTLLSTLNGNIASQSVYNSVRQQLDVDAFADYLILNFWGANVDWPHNNWYAIRHRPTDGPFTFISWDIENFIFATNAIGQLNTNVNNSPGVIWSRLRLNEEFMMYFADRVHEHCFNEGALTPSENIIRFQGIVDNIQSAVNAEGARWGDTREEPPMNTIDQFDPLVSQKINSYFPTRTNIFLNQLRTENLYPETEAPTFSQHGGSIPPGTSVNLDNPNASGTIYFSTVGTHHLLSTLHRSPHHIEPRAPPLSRLRSGQTPRPNSHRRLQLSRSFTPQLPFQRPRHCHG
ncbi:CotH kinase family protein [bacterium]|nr:CotH kinase family protein [bacterium]